MPTIFISHITEERELAGLFKQEIEAKFLGMVDVFMSSDATSIGVGTNWLDKITSGLRNCAAMLLFCSPRSIGRPWINFECGAGWARNIEIAPICHSGMRPVDLPLPISLLQGVAASDPTKLQQVFALIAGKLGSATPVIDAGPLADRIKAFEAEYVEEIEIGNNLRGIADVTPAIVSIIGQLSVGKQVPIQGVPERVFTQVENYFRAMQKMGYIEYNFSVQSMAIGGPGAGAIGDLNLLVHHEAVLKLARRFAPKS